MLKKQKRGDFMKRAIAGFILGAFTAGTIALAASYIAEDASFKILVNGEEFTSSKAVVIDGSTYLPLRALGSVLNVPVAWNDELRQVEVGNSAPVAEKNEYSRKNPAPIGTVQTYTKQSEYSEEDNYTVSVSVLEVIRGDSVLEAIKRKYTVYEEPDEGYEYVNVKIAFSVISTKGDFSVEPYGNDFTAFTSNNEECPYYGYSSEMEPNLGGRRLFEGGSAEGWITVQVKKDDPAPKLAYGLELYGTNGIWFALN